ncbi:hypothetical protein [Tissierella simiarum]|nr:hypothetical protein [Tissierella simiarum]
MTFTENSYLVKFYIRKINEGTISKDDVPSLYNLKEEVEKMI